MKLILKKNEELGYVKWVLRSILVSGLVLVGGQFLILIPIFPSSNSVSFFFFFFFFFGEIF
jgi:hypothetical protein